MNKNQGRVYAAIAKSNLTKGIKMIKISRDIVRSKKTPKCRWREKKRLLCLELIVREDEGVPYQSKDHVVARRKGEKGVTKKCCDQRS